MNLTHIPHSPGVYLMRDNQGKIIYIGKAKDLRKRVSSYFRRDLANPKLAVMLSVIQQIDYIPTSSEKASLLLEQRLIHRVQPSFNVMWRDDKSFPLVKLTMQEDYPRVFMTRQKKKDGSRYFGPYPNVRAVKRLLRVLWRKKYFPLRPCRYDFKEDEIVSPGGLEKTRPSLYKKVKSCIYLHTGECPAPCVGKISRGDYLKIARDAELFFKGRTRPLHLKWKREMDERSKRLDYEGAAEFRDRIEAIGDISEKVILKKVDGQGIESQTRTSRSLTELQGHLGLPVPPIRIEGFDISNIQSVEPVASMVVFERGQPQKSQYRKFKIRSVTGQDDFAMMGEVVYRRYRRVAEEGGKLPDLILIDGGKGQLSAALKSLDRLRGEKKIPRRPSVVSLAKQEEEIFVPGRTGPVVLPKDSPALHVLQAVRDEAHRFAVAFHRRRRDKASLQR